MHTIIEIGSPLVPALRLSGALPNTGDHGAGKLHLLLDATNHPVGYMVEKIALEDAWESLDPRFFLTTSHREALQYLAVPYSELPAREVVAG